MRVGVVDSYGEIRNFPGDCLRDFVSDFRRGGLLYRSRAVGGWRTDHPLLKTRKKTIRIKGDGVMRLKGKVAVVTGAGSGLGKTIAQKLAAEGAKVALADIPWKMPKRQPRRFKRQEVRLRRFLADITSEEQIQKMFVEVESKFGGIDLLYNNAGVSPVGTVETTTYQDFQKVLAIDLYSVFWGVSMSFHT